MSRHTDIAGRLVDQFGERLVEGPDLSHDALNLSLDNGVALQMRVVSDEEYSIRWSYGEAALGIDTAPVHPGLATFPHHLHRPDGVAYADPVTQPGRPAWDNVRALLVRVLDDPLLER